MWGQGTEVVYALDLLVYHDADFATHRNAELVASEIANIALLRFSDTQLVLAPGTEARSSKSIHLVAEPSKVEDAIVLLMIPKRLYRYRGYRKRIDSYTSAIPGPAQEAGVGAGGHVQLDVRSPECCQDRRELRCGAWNNKVDWVGEL